MNRRSIWIISIIVVLAGIALWYFLRPDSSNSSEILVKPTYGTFEVSITTSGELRAKRSTKIMGPMNIRKAGINQIKISDLVDEGTIVEKGDYVAQLDKTDFYSKIQEIEINVQKRRSELKTAMLDSTLTLGEAREDIVNLNYSLEEAKLGQEQSLYEPPAAQRQAEINHEKSIRALAQAKSSYVTKVEQAKTKVDIAQSDLDKQLNKYNEMMEIIQGLEIIAPERGMVIYAREWDGTKKIVGSMIRTWDPVIATLPDLSDMESVTYINEVDIQKARTGLLVEIGLDADPDKKLIGKVVTVANIGEQLPNSDAKVFQVVVSIEKSDSTLRPSMTTSNKIVVSAQEDALFIALECVHSNDSISFVYKKDGLNKTRQEVKLGGMNENEVIIKSGIEKGDQVYLSTPLNPDDFQWNYIDSTPSVQVSR